MTRWTVLASLALSIMMVLVSILYFGSPGATSRILEPDNSPVAQEENPKSDDVMDDGISEEVSVRVSSIPMNVPNGGWAFRCNVPHSTDYGGIASFDDRIYLFGGLDYDNWLGNCYPELNTTYEYNSTTNQWSEMTPMPIAISTENQTPIRAQTFEDRIFVIIGHNGTTLEYDPTNDTWASKTPMPLSLGWSLFGTAVMNDRIYVIGGGFNLQYDPANDTWALKTPPGINRNGAAIVAFPPNCLLSVGGIVDSTGMVTDAMECYDVTFDIWWLYVDSCPIADMREVLAVHLNDSIYFLGRVPDTGVTYDPSLYQMIHGQLGGYQWVKRAPSWFEGADYICYAVGCLDNLYVISGGSMLVFDPNPPNFVWKDLEPLSAYLGTSISFSARIENNGYSEAVAKHLNAQFITGKDWKDVNTRIINATISNISIPVGGGIDISWTLSSSTFGQQPGNYTSWLNMWADNGSSSPNFACLLPVENMWDETLQFTMNLYLNNSMDSDQDQMPDLWEYESDLNWTDPSDGSFDFDGDGLFNYQEYLNGSSPSQRDTDGDQLGDAFEVLFSKTDPNNWDTDNNGIGDGIQYIEERGCFGDISELPDGWIGMTIVWSGYCIFVETNSSVLEGSFDKDLKKLSINLEGPVGTTGAMKLKIPKNLCNVSELQIQIDGNSIEFNATQNGTYNIIYIEYHHSRHVLSASFGSSSSSSVDSLIMPLILIVAVVIVIMTYVYHRAKTGKRPDHKVDMQPVSRVEATRTVKRKLK